MNINIKNIKICDKNIYKKQLRTIYKVVEDAYCKESYIFPDNFIKKCKDHANEDQFLLHEVKNIK